MNDMFNLACKPYALEYGVYKCSKSLSERFDDGKIHIVYAGTFDPSKGGKAAVEAAAYLTKIIMFIFLDLVLKSKNLISKEV